MPKSSIYGAAAAEIWELFGSYVDGNDSGIAVVVSTDTLSDAARDALQKSLTSVGYGANPCTFATLRGADDAEGAILLDASAVFMLVEGLDPLCLICTDSEAARALGTAYRQTVKLDVFEHVFGRPAAVFSSFEHMLESADDKQRAWAILKKLAR